MEIKLKGDAYPGQYHNKKLTGGEYWAKAGADTMQDLMDFFGIGTNRRQQEYNSAEAQVQRNYETNMSNTAYQRAVQDMEKAGLNPVLAMSAGSQASTPSGASASGGSSSNQLGAIANLIATNSAQKLKERELQLAKAKLKQDTTIKNISPFNGKAFKITKIIKH